MSNDWIAAAVALGGGIVLGALVGFSARRLLGRIEHPGLRSIAAATSVFLFWLGVSAGVLVAIAFVNPATLDTIPSDILSWLPNVLAAGLVLLAGVAAGIAAAAAVGRALSRATGARSPGVERAIRLTIVFGAGILALGQLGVDTTILIVLIASLGFALATACALLIGLGGRNVARQIAAGRALRADLRPGAHIRLPDGAEGRIREIRPTRVHVEIAPGEFRAVPYEVLLSEPYDIVADDAAD
ncbi:MAG: hypothetical protein OXG55_05555 [bacterium]|nr:hypothetical protein [bacterium]